MGRVCVCACMCACVRTHVVSGHFLGVCSEQTLNCLHECLCLCLSLWADKLMDGLRMKQHRYVAVHMPMNLRGCV